MKKIIFSILLVLSIINPIKAAEVDEDAIIEQNRLYALEQINDQMSEHEKAMFFGIYVQEGNGYKSSSTGNNQQDYDSVFVEHASVCAGFNQAYQFLNSSAGISCEYLASNLGNHAWNICNLDDEWTYFDSTKSGKEPARLNFATRFKSKTDIKNSTVSSMVNFNDAYFKSNNFLTTPTNLPEGVTSNVSISSYSQTFYVSGYKYYLMGQSSSSGWTNALYKENILSGSKEKLTDVLYDVNDTGLVKENNLLYYVGTDKSLNSIDITNNKITKLKSLSGTSGIINVFIRDGYIYYSVYDSSSKLTSETSYKKLTTWSEIKTYDVSGENYNLTYIESPNNVVIVKAVSKNNGDISGNLVIPDTINNKPVVGIGNYAFRRTNLTGNIILPKKLLYIGDDAFAYSEKLSGNISFPTTLKSIGSGAFLNVPITGELNIPDNVSYIGVNSFNETSISSLKLSKNLKYLSRGAFSWSRELKGILEIPDDVEYIGQSAFSYYNQLSAVIVGKNVKEIAKNAFLNSKNLEEIIILSENVEQMDLKDVSQTIYIPKNSQTENYAKENNIPYEELTQKVVFEETELSGNVGDTINLNYTVTPKYYFDKNLDWSSTNDLVATVKDGEVRLVGKGDVTIKVKSVTGNIATCHITVKDIKLSLNHTKYQLNSSSDKLTLIASVEKEKYDNVKWSSSDDEVASVKDGVVTPKKGGLVYIKATSDKYGSSECLIYVCLPITLSDGSKKYYGDINGDGIFDSNDTNMILNIFKYGASADDILIADFDGDGNITTSDAAEFNNYMKYFTPGEYKHIDSVKLSKDNLTLKINGNDNLVATINPIDTTDSDKLTWKSSNKLVAEVDENGRVRGLNNGTSEITVTTSNGKSAKCLVTVGTGINEYIKGDLDESGDISVIDAVEALYYSIGKREVTSHKLLIGDFDNDKEITVIDAIEILKLLIK